MIPFPSQMITLKSGGNQMKFTHGRNPPSFPIENVQEGFWPLQLPIFYNGNGVGLRPWVNFVWSSPDFRVTIYDGNGHISPARKTRFGFDHILSHPIQREPSWLLLSVETRPLWVIPAGKPNIYLRANDFQFSRWLQATRQPSIFMSETWSNVMTRDFTPRFVT